MKLVNLYAKHDSPNCDYQPIYNNILGYVSEGGIIPNMPNVRLRYSSWDVRRVFYNIHIGHKNRRFEMYRRFYTSVIFK